MLITRGEGMFESGPTGTRQINATAILITTPGVWHRYRPAAETGWGEYWVGMNGEQLHRLQRQGILRPEDPILPLDDCEELVGIFEDLIDRIRMNPQRTHSIATVALQVLASALELAEARPLPQRTTPMQSAEDAVIAEAVQFIWDHSARPMTVDDLVDQLPVSRRSLERRFRKALGAEYLGGDHSVPAAEGQATTGRNVTTGRGGRCRCRLLQHGPDERGIPARRGGFSLGIPQKVGIISLAAAVAKAVQVVAIRGL